MILTVGDAILGGVLLLASGALVGLFRSLATLGRG